MVQHLAPSPGARLRELIQRKDQVLAVLHTPSAALARIMELGGCEAGFVGTSGVVGAYTGLADVGTATMTECVTIAGWISQTVRFPVIMDGDTGHGGIMAVRRMVRECIRAGIAGVRIDDQPIEGKRRTQTAGVEVVPLEQAVARYRAAVDMKNELDPDFVVMAQCYARDAAGGGLVDCLRRLRAYENEAGVDWVQFESPHSEDEIRRARAVVKGPFSFMKGTAAALSRSRRASGPRRQYRLVSGFHSSGDLGGAVGFHAAVPGQRHRRMGGIRASAPRSPLSAARAGTGRGGSRNATPARRALLLGRGSGQVSRNLDVSSSRRRPGPISVMAPAFAGVTRKSEKSRKRSVYVEGARKWRAMASGFSTPTPMSGRR